MKHIWLLGALAGAMLAANVAAATPGSQTPAGTQKPTTTTQKPAPTTEKPTPGTTQGTATGARRQGTMRTPAQVPTGEAVLGTITLPRAVMANGETLRAGRYTVRLTAQTAQPTVPGQQADLNRWVEFVQGGTARGREVVSIIPADEVNDTQQGPDLEVNRSHVPRGGSRVEVLKGGDYVRVWFNRDGNNYLVHLPPAGPAR